MRLRKGGSIRIAVIRLAVGVITSRAALSLVALVVTLIVIILGIALILRIADGVATECAKACADCCAFQAATALIADDTTGCGTTERADDCTRLGVWSGGARDKAESREEREND